MDKEGPDTLYVLRMLLTIWLVGVLGTTAELLLLAHFDGFLQVIPLVVLAIGLLAAAWYVTRPGTGSLRAFRSTLLLFAISGALGLYLHYRGNVEFEKERDPTLGAFQLFWEAITGATPALAPGTMILLAMIGYAMTIVSRRTDSAL
jgi:hypothetical protein